MSPCLYLFNWFLTAIEIYKIIKCYNPSLVIEQDSTTVYLSWRKIFNLNSLPSMNLNAIILLFRQCLTNQLETTSQFASVPINWFFMQRQLIVQTTHQGKADWNCKFPECQGVLVQSYDKLISLGVSFTFWFLFCCFPRCMPSCSTTPQAHCYLEFGILLK